jgi:hypothetical protein
MVSVHVDRKIMPIMEGKLGESYPEIHVKLEKGVVQDVSLYGNGNGKLLTPPKSVQEVLAPFKGKNITDVIKTMYDAVKVALEKEYGKK